MSATDEAVEMFGERGENAQIDAFDDEANLAGGRAENLSTSASAHFAAGADAESRNNFKRAADEYKRAYNDSMQMVNACSKAFNALHNKAALCEKLGDHRAAADAQRTAEDFLQWGKDAQNDAMQAQEAETAARKAAGASQIPIALAGRGKVKVSGLDLLGADEVDFTTKMAPYAPIAKLAGSLLESGGKYMADKQAEERSAEETKKLLDRAIAADAAATQAVTMALVSAELKSNSMASDASAASVAENAQDAAGAALPSDLFPQRIAAAEKALVAAQAKLKAAKTAGAKKLAQFGITAAEKTLNKARNQQIVMKDSPGAVPKSTGALSFLRTKYGPLPLYGWGLGAGALGVGGYVLYRVLGRK